MNKKKNYLEGIIPVIVTPMLSDGEIDKTSTFKLISYLTKKKVSGFWCLGSTGEELNISRKKRLSFIRTVVEANYRKLPIITGTGENNSESILEFIDQIKDLNINGIQYLPRDTKISEDQLIKEIDYLQKKSTFPIWLYNNILRGKELSYNLLKRVCNFENIHGVKYGAKNHLEYIRVTSLHKKTFQVLSAGNFFLGNLFYGCDAGTSSEANCWPEQYVKIYNLFKKKKFKNAIKLQNSLIELSKSIPKTNNGENSAEEKFILSIKGICKPYVNNMYRMYSEKEKRNCKKVIKKYKVI